MVPATPTASTTAATSTSTNETPGRERMREGAAAGIRVRHRNARRRIESTRGPGAVRRAPEGSADPATRAYASQTGSPSRVPEPTVIWQVLVVPPGYDTEAEKPPVVGVIAPSVTPVDERYCVVERVEV